MTPTRTPADRLLTGDPLNIEDMNGPMLVLRLSQRINDEVAGSRDRQAVTEALTVAIRLHQNGRRHRHAGVEPSIDAVLRRTLFLFGCGITDCNTLITSLIHEVVDVSPKLFASLYQRYPGEASATSIVDGIWGDHVARAVTQLNTPQPNHLNNDPRLMDVASDNVLIIRAIDLVEHWRTAASLAEATGQNYRIMDDNDRALAHQRISDLIEGLSIRIAYRTTSPDFSSTQWSIARGHLNNALTHLNSALEFIDRSTTP